MDAKALAVLKWGLTATSIVIIGWMNWRYLAGEYTTGAFVKAHWPMYVLLFGHGIPAAALWLRRE